MGDMQGGIQTEETMNEMQHELGDTVYLKHDPEEVARMVTGIVIRPTGVLYQLSAANENGFYYAIEISKERKSDSKTGAGFKK